jgi:hypothetical protein
MRPVRQKLLDITSKTARHHKFRLYRSRIRPKPCGESSGRRQILTPSGGAYPELYGSFGCLGHKMVFGTSGPGENPPKLLRLKLIFLANGMIAQIRLKKYFFA